MAKSLAEMKAGLSPERLERVNARVNELELEHQTLMMLRKAHGLTQKQLANQLGVDQGVISRQESQSDMMLSTLGNFVQAIGGTIDLVAKFPGKAPVKISGFSDLKEPKTPKFSTSKPDKKDTAAAR